MPFDRSKPKFSHRRSPVQSRMPARKDVKTGHVAPALPLLPESLPQLFIPSLVTHTHAHRTPSVSLRMNGCTRALSRWFWTTPRHLQIIFIGSCWRNAIVILLRKLRSNGCALLCLTMHDEIREEGVSFHYFSTLWISRYAAEY